MNKGRIHRRVGQRCLYIRFGDRVNVSVATVTAVVARRTWKAPMMAEYDVRLSGGHVRRAIEDELVPIRGRALHGLQEITSTPTAQAPPPVSRPKGVHVTLYPSGPAWAPWFRRQ